MESCEIMSSYCYATGAFFLLQESSSSNQKRIYAEGAFEIRRAPLMYLLCTILSPTTLFI